MNDELKKIASALTEALNATDADGTYAGLLQKRYPAKRKAPDSIGRMVKQWVWVSRELLTIEELHWFLRGMLQRDKVHEAYALLEERGLLVTP